VAAVPAGLPARIRLAPRAAAPSPRQVRAKRWLEVASAALAGVLLSPLAAVVAVVVRRTSPGPALFRQERVGRGGKPFVLVKFRTMTVDAEAEREALLARSRDPNWLHLDHDPRVTPVGRLLRRSSLDELPQLWNVLRGEMSLVGPRPLIPVEHERLPAWARVRVDVAPGLTGLWQVSGRTAIPFEGMLVLDRLYVTHWSLRTDLQILARTLPAVLSGRGAN
jgi:lipopolysaccharide/colanic/teichoic acid biosynthesis glycosyltransferase